MEYLQVREGSTVLDCTLGLAGHAVEIVRRLGPAGTLIGLTAIDGAGEKRI